MRIITGKAKGIVLKTLSGDATRPTTDRVKEAVFSMIQFDIEGRKVLDLFAGSGQLALEALSRGASEAVMCDSSREAVTIIKKNAEKTRLASKCRINLCDANAMIGKLGDERFDIVFLDPPYSLNLIPGVLRKLLECGKLKNTSTIVCETAEAEDVFGNCSELAAAFTVKRASRYGAAFVTVLSPKEDAV